MDIDMAKNSGDKDYHLANQLKKEMPQERVPRNP